MATSERMGDGGPALSPLRLEWLAHLATHGETPWERMPRKQGRGNRFTGKTTAASNRTWRPMVDAGWIASRYGRRVAHENADILFSITETGLAMLAARSQP